MRPFKKLYFAYLLLTAPGLVSAQGVLMISNTNQPFNAYRDEVYGARAVFVPGFDPGGYQLTGFTIELGNNSSISHGPMHVILYGSNSPGNLDTDVSDFFVDVPPAAGTYFFPWPVNCYIPPQYSIYPDYYYHLLLVPNSQDELNVADTTSTDYTQTDAWTFYPEASYIDGTGGICPLVNIYATILPPPLLYPIRLRHEAVLPDDSFQFDFTNSPSYSFSVYFTTNVALPFAKWLYAGPADNIASNYFLFNTGPNVVHSSAFPPHLYFRVTSP